MEQLYKENICTNCENKNCTNNIKRINFQEVVDDQISTTTIIKCDDFIAKNKRNKESTNWQKWQGFMRIGEIIKRKNKDTYRKLLTMKGAKHEKKMDKA